MQTDTVADRDIVDADEIARLVHAMRERGQPETLFDAVMQAAQRTIGFRLFTIMCFDAERFEVERLYTNMPDVYPLNGRKKKRGSAWGDHTLRDLKPFRAATPQGIADSFDDSSVMIGMGLGSILNIPVAYDGRCVGTMNLTHVEGWYRQRHEETGLLLASFLAAPLALHQARGR